MADANSGPLSAEEFAKVAAPGCRRLTVAEVRRLMSAPSGQRQRVYALWNGQIVAVQSDQHVDKYRQDVRAWWMSSATISDMIREA